MYTSNCASFCIGDKPSPYELNDYLERGYNIYTENYPSITLGRNITRYWVSNDPRNITATKYNINEEVYESIPKYIRKKI